MNGYLWTICGALVAFFVGGLFLIMALNDIVTWQTQAWCSGLGILLQVVFSKAGLRRQANDKKM